MAAVPRAGDGLTRIGFGVGRFLSRLLASRERSRAPQFPGRVGRASLAEGGPPARDGQTHGQTGSPGGPTEGGAAGAGLRATAPALALAWLRVRWRVRALAGRRAGLPPRRLPPAAGPGEEGRGEVSIQECASELLLFPPRLLKSKSYNL